MAFIIDDLLLLPFNLAKKVLEGIINEVDKERLVTRVGVIEKLKEFQMLLEEGKISEEDYSQIEKELIQRLKEIKKTEE
ncbi:MAG: gas vesicle protein GvpG [Candidatus Atribacteria bacterium]|nr:gas vesicle protein GvpG [Candidatus Atribacteria bacterium]